jgi:citrate lyase subunit beta / citryl-CoA lyase
MTRTASPSRPTRWRSALFTPGTAPERAAKLPALGCDIGIIDLEDAVPESAKESAREQVRAAAAEIIAAAPQFALFVRVNPVPSPHHGDDLARALVAGLRGVVLPKVDSPRDLDGLGDRLGALGLGSIEIVAGIETGRGVLDARAIAEHPRVSAVYFGAEDLVADIGGERTPEGLEVLYPRSRIALVASVAGVASLDGIVADYSDDDRFRQEAALARALSYSGKICIHPRQVPLANEAFTPSDAQVAHARRVLDAYADASAQGRGAISVDGSMVDEPMARRARSVIEAADRDV